MKKDSVQLRPSTGQVQNSGQGQPTPPASPARGTPLEPDGSKIVSKKSVQLSPSIGSPKKISGQSTKKSRVQRSRGSLGQRLRGSVGHRSNRSRPGSNASGTSAELRELIKRQRSKNSSGSLKTPSTQGVTSLTPIIKTNRGSSTPTRDFSITFESYTQEITPQDLDEKELNKEKDEKGEENLKKKKLNFNPCCSCGGRIKFITWCKILAVIEMFYSIVFFTVKMLFQTDRERLIDYGKSLTVFMDTGLIGSVILSFIASIALLVASCFIIGYMALFHAIFDSCLVVLMGILYTITIVYGMPTHSGQGNTRKIGLLVSYSILFPIKIYTIICSFALWTRIRAGLEDDRNVRVIEPATSKYTYSVI